MAIVTDDIATWVIAGVTVARADYNYGDATWIPSDAISSEEPLIGGRVFRDVAGAWSAGLQLKIMCNSLADRNTILSRVGTVVSVAKPGETLSGNYTLKSAQPLMIATGIYGAIITLK